MRILFVTPFYKPAYVYGGPSRCIPELCEGLAALGNDVEVYTTDANGRTRLPSPGAPVETGGVRVHYFPLAGATRYYRSPQLAHACRRNIRTFELAYIYSNWSYPLLHACKAAHRSHIPYVVAPKASFMRRTWKHKYCKKLGYHFLAERLWINRAAALHYTTELEKRESEWLRLSPESFIVPEPVNVAEFSNLPQRGTFRKRFGLTARHKVLLHLGRIEPQKGLELTLDGFARMAAAFTDATLILAGPEEDGHGKALRRRARNLGIADRVVFAGMLDSEERIGALRDADIFILTSHSENFAIAAAEAMAAGVPVVVSDRVGIAAEILRCDAGFVTSLDATEISIVLRRLFADAELRQRLGRNAARLVRDMYAPHLIAQKIGTNLQRIAALRGKRRPETPYGSPKPLSDIIPSDRM